MSRTTATSAIRAKARISFSHIVVRVVASVCVSIFLYLTAALPQPLARPSTAAAGEAEQTLAQPSGLSVTQPTTSLQSMLNSDGPLNLSDGFRGSLDARGWQMISSPGAPPRFVPSTTSTSLGPKPDHAIPQVPGDENWDGRFGIDSVNSTVYAVAVSGIGDLYIGGGFTTAGGISASHIARWNGSTWSALGSGTNGVIWSVGLYGSTVEIDIVKPAKCLCVQGEVASRPPPCKALLPFRTLGERPAS